MFCQKPSLSVPSLYDKVADKDTGVSRGSPFDGHVPAGVEHKTVAHVVLEQVVVQNARLTQNYPMRRSVLEQISLCAEFGDRVEVEYAGHKRIAHAAPGVFPVSVAVFRYRADVNVFDLVGAVGLADRIDEFDRSVEVRLLRGFRIVIRDRRDDRGAMDDVVALCNAVFAVFLVVEIAEYDFEIGAVFLLQLSRELFVGRLLSEQDDALEFTGLHYALEHLAAHRAGRAGH